MAVVLYAVGVVVSFAGFVLALLGIPDKEFSFGNTLIVAGTIAFTGGLIVMALGAVVAQIRRLGESRVTLPAVPGMKGFDELEPAATPATSARIPFPPKPKAITPEPEPIEEAPAPPAAGPARRDFADRNLGPLAAPMLPNPVEPHVFEAEETSEATLSPRQPPNSRPSFEMSEPPAMTPPPVPKAAPPAARPRQESNWRPNAETGRPATPTGDSRFFEAMWPGGAKPRAAQPASTEPPPPPRSEMRAPPPPPAPPPIPRMTEPKIPESRFPEPRMPEPVNSNAPQGSPAVAVLKSGVVDGMAYTLYVDGSIEAELPTGVLHFESINELRAHLERTRAQ